MCIGLRLEVSIREVRLPKLLVDLLGGSLLRLGGVLRLRLRILLWRERGRERRTRCRAAISMEAWLLVEMISGRADIRHDGRRLVFQSNLRTPSMNPRRRKGPRAEASSSHTMG